MAQLRPDLMFRHTQIPDPRAIRILVLEPTIDTSSEIKCSLYFSSLDDPLEFEALSYSWDSQTLSNPILCRQLFIKSDVYCTLNVTYNCLAALKQLRLSDTPRPLWIDSICIDQTNVEERNQQISLMGELYPSARHVIVWVGEKDDATEQAMQFITDFGSGIISPNRSVDERKDEVFTLLYERLIKIKSTPDGELSDKLRPLFERSWFHRMWTVQEVTIPPAQDVTMYCGDASMQFLHLYFFVRFAVKKFYFTDNKIRDAMELQEIILSNLVEGHTEYDRTDGVTEDPLSSSTVFNFAHVLKRKIPRKGTNTKITPILSKARFKSSTDAKDKIFALLGVFEYLGVQMPPPDYHKSIEAIYTEATTSAITFDKSLGILLQCPSEHRNSHLPSWVPDFSIPGFLVDDPRDPSDDLKSFKASPSMIPQWRFSGDDSLTIRGKIVDVVETRLPCFSPALFFSSLKDLGPEASVPIAPGLPDGPERLREMHEMFEVITSWIQSCANQTNYPNGEPIQTALYRTLVNDLDVLNKLARKDDGFATWSRIMKADERDRLQMTIDSQDKRNLKNYNAKIDKSSRPALLKSMRKWAHSSFDSAISAVHRKGILDEVLEKIDPHQITGGAILELGVFSLNACICSQSRKKAFYVTQKQCFGTAPDRISVSIESGDRIAVLAGLNVPVVLRPRPDRTYAFVSHCYLHGFMHGEAFNGHTEELQDIVLV